MAQQPELPTDWLEFMQKMWNPMSFPMPGIGYDIGFHIFCMNSSQSVGSSGCCAIVRSCGADSPAPL